MQKLLNVPWTELSSFLKSIDTFSKSQPSTEMFSALSVVSGTLTTVSKKIINLFYQKKRQL